MKYFGIFENHPQLILVENHLNKLSYSRRAVSENHASFESILHNKSIVVNIDVDIRILYTEETETKSFIVDSVENILDTIKSIINF